MLHRREPIFNRIYLWEVWNRKYVLNFTLMEVGLNSTRGMPGGVIHQNYDLVASLRQQIVNELQKYLTI